MWIQTVDDDGVDRMVETVVGRLALNWRTEFVVVLRSQSKSEGGKNQPNSTN